MKLMKKLKFVTALIMFYNPARDYAAHKEYGKAKQKLEDYFRWMAAESAYPEANVLMSLVSFRLGELPSALNCATVAFDQLDRGGWNYKPADKEYLKYYCSNLIRFICSQNQIGLADSRFENTEYRDLDLSAVHQQIRSNFPLLKQASIA